MLFDIFIDVFVAFLSHPDKNSDDDAQEKFIQITKAYDVSAFIYDPSIDQLFAKVLYY